MLPWLLAAVSGAAGYLLAAAPSTPASTDPTALAALTAEVRQLTQQVAGLDQLSSAPAGPAPAATTTALRERVPTSDDIAAADAEVTRREPSARAPLATELTVDSEVLRRARLQNPQPNLAAVAAAHAHLGEATDPTTRRSHQRQWWLLGMDEVVTRLGMPDNMLANNNDLLWEYFLPGDRQLLLTFRHGVVVKIVD